MKVLTVALATAFLAFGTAGFAECSWKEQQAEKPQTVVKLPAVRQDDAES